MLHAVVMAGGSGTRFWPQSRRHRPKQLLRLAGPDTMLQATVARIADLIPGERTLIVTNDRLSDETGRQLPTVSAANILREPCGRNTAPCVGWAALHLLQQDPEAIMLVMPADHVIRPESAFQSAVSHAVQIVQESPDSLVLFGIPPTYPATGYGYIERAEKVPGAVEVYRVERFREKPNVETAREFIASGRFYWNCGIFVWSARTIVEELRRNEPEMIAALERIVGAPPGESREAALRTGFPELKSISIDYAVLEKAKNVRVMPASFEWDDVGSWRSLERLLGQDAEGNTVDGRFASVGAKGCIVRTTTPGHLVAAIGVEDLIIVQTPDATLVARKDDENAIRKLVELLEQRGDESLL